MSLAKAFAPANISCIFKIHEHENPRWMGSYGLGFTLNEGVTVTASNSKRSSILFNSRPINFPAVKRVIEMLTKESVRIQIKTKLPLGCGFGLSGASALAAAYSANSLLKLNRSARQLAVAAHTAEVECKTGLGDVTNQYFGGLCLKLKPSSHFIVEKLPVTNDHVYCRHFGRLSTKSIITNPEMKKKINEAASEALKKISKKSDFGTLIRISKKFASESGLLRDKKTIDMIKSIEKEKGNASMIMLGNAVFSDISFKGASRYKISGRGAMLL